MLQESGLCHELFETPQTPFAHKGTPVRNLDCKSNRQSWIKSVKLGSPEVR